MAQQFLEETHQFAVAPPPIGPAPKAKFAPLTSETQELSAEEARMQKHMVNKPGFNQQSFNQEPEPQAVRRTAGPAKIESWVDLHNEYADILDQQELQKYRRHFRAFGANDAGFITCDALREVMETFFGQDLTKAQVMESVSQIDYDGDGQISYREFLESMCAIKSGAKKTKFAGFYMVLTLKNPPFWAARVGRANSAV